ncbi:MAG: DNA primase [Betaproteobacteria bacterium]|nr:DNA primase [Betaproteobacteria bacterium]
MPIETLLSRLGKVRPSGTGRWAACCPAHDDRNPSLSIRELDDGRALVHCFAGCQVSDVLAAIGLSLPDLFPERLHEHFAPEHRPFPAADVLCILSFEVLLVAASGASVMAGEPLSQKEHDRLMLAVERIQMAVDVAEVRHG